MIIQFSLTDNPLIAHCLAHCFHGDKLRVFVAGSEEAGDCHPSLRCLMLSFRQRPLLVVAQVQCHRNMGSLIHHTISRVEDNSRNSKDDLASKHIRSSVVRRQSASLETQPSVLIVDGMINNKWYVSPVYDYTYLCISLLIMLIQHSAKKNVTFPEVDLSTLTFPGSHFM